MHDIVILGAGGFARNVAFLIEEINRVELTWNLLGFVEADGKLVGKQIGKYKVVCTDEELSRRHIAAAIGVASSSLIRKIVDRFEDLPNIYFPNLMHPSVILDHDTIIFGNGNIICPGTIFTTDSKIGSFNVFNKNSILGEEVCIGDCSVFNPGMQISGRVDIGSRCLIGAGAIVLQDIKIGDDVVVGAGALVTKDVPLGFTVVGVPAKPLIRKGDEKRRVQNEAL